MKYYHYIFAVFMLAASPMLTSCNDDHDVVLLTEEGEPMTVTDISPAEGYAGGTFAVNGTNFGAADQLIEVKVGDVSCPIISCSDARITVRVPEGLTSGKVTIGLKGGESVTTDYTFNVIKPNITSTIDKAWIGTTITLSGSKLPAQAEKDNITVFIGDTQANVSDYTVDAEGNGSFIVTIPNTLKAGTYSLNANLYGANFFTSDIEIDECPTVQSLDGQMIGYGTLTIKGKGFQDFAGQIKVHFGETDVDATVISDTEMTVNVPESYTEGEVTVSFGDQIPPVTLGTPVIFAIGDITEKMLPNSIAPMAYDEALMKDNWAIPTGWRHIGDLGSYGYLTSSSVFGATARNPYPINSKMYQVVTLPAGSYTLKLDLEQVSNTKGRFGAYLMVTRGNGTIPDLSDALTGHKKVWWPVVEDDIIASYRITDNKTTTQETRTLDFTLDQQQELTIGFVYNINGDGKVLMSGLHLIKNS